MSINLQVYCYRHLIRRKHKACCREWRLNAKLSLLDPWWLLYLLQFALPWHKQLLVRIRQLHRREILQQILRKRRTCLDQHHLKHGHLLVWCRSFAKVINLVRDVICIITYSKKNGVPCLGLAVINKDFRVTVISFETTVEENFLLIEHIAGVMGDLTGTLTMGLHTLPFDRIEGIRLEGMDSCKTHSPHCVNWSFFQISAAVDVQAR